MKNIFLALCFLLTCCYFTIGGFMVIEGLHDSKSYMCLTGKKVTRLVYYTGVHKFYALGCYMGGTVD